MLRRLCNYSIFFESENYRNTSLQCFGNNLMVAAFKISPHEILSDEGIWEDFELYYCYSVE